MAPLLACERCHIVVSASKTSCVCARLRRRQAAHLRPCEHDVPLATTPSQRGASASPLPTLDRRELPGRVPGCRARLGESRPPTA